VVSCQHERSDVEARNGLHITKLAKDPLREVSYIYWSTSDLAEVQTDWLKRANLSAILITRPVHIVWK
jgi:hypothetical protein